MHPLVDPVEMYLRTLYELEEEGIRPIRARVAERLHLAAPTVSEAFARLEEDGLVRLAADRTLVLTEAGRDMAVRVMRRHRLAERLLADVLGVDRRLVHTEACRWEHVISDEVEERLVVVLGKPERDVHGNPIPGLGAVENPDELVRLSDPAATGWVRIRRVSEHLQADVDRMQHLEDAGLQPGAIAEVRPDGEMLRIRSGNHELLLDRPTAKLVFVAPLGAAPVSS